MPYTNEEIIELLRVDAELYSKYAGSWLEFLHSKSKNSPLQKNVIYFGQEHFMHLVGVKSKTYYAAEFYEHCLDRSIEIEDCTPVHDAKNRNEKVSTFPKLFDFARSAIYKIGEKDLSTAYDDFFIATGNSDGTIGYDFRDINSDHPFPVTLLTRPLWYYCSEANRILAVAQKFEDGSSRVVFEIRKGLYEGLTAGII